MTFLAPLFLLAALAAAIPVIIHFLNLKKPRKVAFSTLSFFRELQKSTIRRLKIKRLLLLAVRILTILMLAFALARPYLPPGWTGSAGSSPVLYSFLIDNGIGMDRIDADGPYLDQAVQLVRDVIGSSRDNDRFILYYSHGESPRSAVLTSDQAISALEGLSVSMTGNLAPKRFRELSALMESWPGDRRVLYRITTQDGVKRDLDIPQPDFEGLSDVSVNYIVIGNDRISNTVVTDVAITSVPAGPGRPVGIEVTLANLGNRPSHNQFISLETDGVPGGQHQVDLEPGEVRKLLFEAIPARSGTIPGKLIIEGDQFQHDNTYYFSVNIPAARNILLIDDAGENTGSYLDAALSAAEQLQGRIRVDRTSGNTYQDKTPIDDYDVIILNGVARIPDDLQEQLVQVTQRGGGLVIFPSERTDIISYNRFLSRLNAGQLAGFRGDYGAFVSVSRVDRIREGHPVINEIFVKQENEDVRTTLPALFYYLLYRPAPQQGYIPILNSELGDPLLIEHRFGNGRVMLAMVGTDPGWSTFPGSPLFAPVFYRTILYAMSGDSGGLLMHTLGTAFTREHKLDDDRITIQSDGTSYLPEVRPAQSGASKISYEAEEWTPGIYTIRTESAGIHVAANYHISESDFYTLSEDNAMVLLNEKFGRLQVFGMDDVSLQDIQSRVRSAGFGSEVWYWFIVIAVILMMIELAISRWYKAETIS